MQLSAGSWEYVNYAWFWLNVLPQMCTTTSELRLNHFDRSTNSKTICQWLPLDWFLSHILWLFTSFVPYVDASGVFVVAAQTLSWKPIENLQHEQIRIHISSKQFVGFSFVGNSRYQILQPLNPAKTTSYECTNDDIFYTLLCPLTMWLFFLRPGEVLIFPIFQEFLIFHSWTLCIEYSEYFFTKWMQLFLIENLW